MKLAPDRSHSQAQRTQRSARLSPTRCPQLCGAGVVARIGNEGRWRRVRLPTRRDGGSSRQVGSSRYVDRRREVRSGRRRRDRRRGLARRDGIELQQVTCELFEACHRCRTGVGRADPHDDATGPVHPDDRCILVQHRSGLTGDRRGRVDAVQDSNRRACWVRCCRFRGRRCRCGRRRFLSLWR